MLVKNWMRRPVVTVSPDASMNMARELMDQYDIRALPVIKNNKLVGLLTDRDLKKAEASDATGLDAFELGYLLKKVKINEIMKKNPKTVLQNTTLSEAAYMMLGQKLEATPVMTEDDRLIGILTISDVERALITLTAFGRKGFQFGMRFDNSPGALMGIIDTIRNADARLASLITTDTPEYENMREAYFHIYEVNREKLADFTEELKLKGILLYTVDLKTGERRVFE